MREHVALAALLAHLELDLAEEGGQDGGHVADPRDGIRLVGAGRATQGGARDALGGSDGEPRGDARALVDGGRLTQAAGEAGDDLEQVLGHVGDELGLLRDEHDLVGDLGRVVRADLGAEAVLERGDDAAAVGVVLRVGGRDEQQVEREPQRVAADLDVALLEHVEERDLDALGEVGQLVEAEDAAVGARHEAVVHRLGVAEGAALRDLDRVDVADEVADARVGRRELLGVALAAVAPRDRQVVAELGREAAAARARRAQRVVADLAALDDGAPLVEQPAEGAHEAGLALAALAEEHEVVAGEQRRLELGQHGVVEADHAGEGVLAGTQPGEQVVAELRLDAAVLVAGGAQAAEGRRAGVLARVRLAERVTHRFTLRPDPPGVEGSVSRGAVEGMERREGLQR